MVDKVLGSFFGGDMDKQEALVAKQEKALADQEKRIAAREKEEKEKKESRERLIEARRRRGSQTLFGDELGTESNLKEALGA